ncbi:hypothetical protein [Desulfofustis glycolicus]|uniref:Uncharacterized protein n=1 Tax=Desulfofustis glycolicus DSM 9705 TaxID=1121409 RepID=A0A1M5TQN7_9BACT|nr:hypothetical protein [Desulfofustis glycolicus]MCB2216543.1 hypothetical protein [Desulfobulbaceae bacterium]SHH53009.1 hypothetical protein SAMN02745124_00858 [Desulfofustis glycolicus DSM 9705]
MKKVSASASNLKELIKHAIDDLEVTPEEYKNIMEHAHEDGHIDKEEQTLLSQFQSMISNGTIKRVRG